jgi:hypothetical protein
VSQAVLVGESLPSAFEPQEKAFAMIQAMQAKSDAAPTSPVQTYHERAGAPFDEK